MTTIDEFEWWLQKPEGQNLEFKKAENQFSYNKELPDYCAALSNEGGGKLILGVDNSGNIVGTKAFLGNSNQLTHDLMQKIGIRVGLNIYYHTTIINMQSRPVLILGLEGYPESKKRN